MKDTFSPTRGTKPVSVTIVAFSALNHFRDSLSVCAEGGVFDLFVDFSVLHSVLHSRCHGGCKDPLLNFRRHRLNPTVKRIFLIVVWKVGIIGFFQQIIRSPHFISLSCFPFHRHRPEMVKDQFPTQVSPRNQREFGQDRIVDTSPTCTTPFLKGLFDHCLPKRLAEDPWKVIHILQFPVRQVDEEFKTGFLQTFRRCGSFCGHCCGWRALFNRGALFLGHGCLLRPLFNLATLRRPSSLHVTQKLTRQTSEIERLVKRPRYPLLSLQLCTHPAPFSKSPSRNNGLHRRNCFTASSSRASRGRHLG